MSSFGRVPLNDVRAMLDECAAGYTMIERDHHWCVYFRNWTYPRLPKGEHGARKNPEIEVGHIKRMARLFEILDCAKKQIETLR